RIRHQLSPSTERMNTRSEKGSKNNISRTPIQGFTARVDQRARLTSARLAVPCAMRNATVSTKGARRWAAGHPWIYRSDIVATPDDEPGLARVMDQRGRPLGLALWSPRSEISLRLLDRNADATI